MCNLLKFLAIIGYTVHCKYNNYYVKIIIYIIKKMDLHTGYGSYF